MRLLLFRRLGGGRERPEGEGEQGVREEERGGRGIHSVF
jgi:hypothetical protein